MTHQRPPLGRRRRARPRSTALVTELGGQRVLADHDGPPGRRARLVSPRPAATTLPLRLDPLDPRPAGELVRTLLGDAGRPRARRRALDRSGGNPLFLEELAELVQATAAAPPAARHAPGPRRGSPRRAVRRRAEHARERGHPRPVGDVEGPGRIRPCARPDDAPVLDALADAELLDVDGEWWRFRSERARGRLPDAHQGGPGPAPRRRGQGDGDEGTRPAARRHRPPLRHGGRAGPGARRRVPGVPHDVDDQAVQGCWRRPATSTASTPARPTSRSFERSRSVTPADDPTRLSLLLTAATAGSTCTSSPRRRPTCKPPSTRPSRRRHAARPGPACGRDRPADDSLRGRPAGAGRGLPLLPRSSATNELAGVHARGA